MVLSKALRNRNIFENECSKTIETGGLKIAVKKLLKLVSGFFSGYIPVLIIFQPLTPDIFELYEISGQRMAQTDQRVFWRDLRVLTIFQPLKFDIFELQKLVKKTRCNRNIRNH